VLCLSSPLPRRRRALLCVLFAAGLAGCSSQSVENMLDDLPGIAPYRIEIQQGNYVSQDMVAKLKRGMSPEQVRFVLGTPLLTDMFHPNRWDYVFYRERPNKTREERRISVFFENNRLVRVTGDVVPEAASPAGAPPSGAAPKGESSKDKAVKADAVPKDDAVAKDDAAQDAAPKDEAVRNDAASAPVERAEEQAQ
jgi:outer membrane protein assembly factor BamE